MEVVSKYVVHVSHSRVHNWCTSHTYVRLLLLAYAWFWTCVHWHIFSLWFFKVFKLFLVLLFWFFKNLMLYIWPLIYLFLLRRDIFFTIYICFKETLFFNFSHKLSNKHFSLRTSIRSSFFWKGMCFDYLISTIWLYKTGLFEGNFFWVGQYDPPTFILQKELIQYYYNLIQFLSKLSK